jgi:putative ABC transport system permease protein
MVVCLGVSIPTFGLAEGITHEMVSGVTNSHIGHIQLHNPGYPKENDTSQTLNWKIISKKLSHNKDISAFSPRFYTGGIITHQEKFSVEFKELSNPKIMEIIRGATTNNNRCSGAISIQFSEKNSISVGSSLFLTMPPKDNSCYRITVTAIFKDTSMKEANTIFIGAPLMKSLSQPWKRKIIEVKDESSTDDIDSLKKLSCGSEQSHKEDKYEKVVQAPIKWPVAKTLIRKVERSINLPIAVAAVDPSKEKKVTHVSEKLFSGKYLTANYRKNTSLREIHKEILVGKSLARTLMVKPGDIIGLDLFCSRGFLIDDNFKVAGIFQTGIPQMEENLVFIHMNNGWDKDFLAVENSDSQQNKFPIHEVSIRLKNTRVINRVSKELKVLLGKTVLVRNWREIKPSMAKVIRLQEGLIAMILIIILVVAVLGTTNTMMMSVLERTGEFGLLKAIGMKPLFIVLLILMESVIISLISLIIGGGIGIAICSYLGVHGIDLSMFLSEGFTLQGVLLNPLWKTILTFNSVFIPTTILLLSTLLASFLPAIRAARMSPIKELRDEL